MALDPSRASANAPQRQELAQKGRAFQKKVRREYKPFVKRVEESVFEDWTGVPKPLDEKRGMNPLNRVLLSVVSSFEWVQEEGIEKEQLREGWKRAAGDFIAANADLMKIEKGVAVVQVLQPTLRYHLHQWNAPLLEKLREEFGRDKVERVSFIFG